MIPEDFIQVNWVTVLKKDKTSLYVMEEWVTDYETENKIKGEGSVGTAVGPFCNYSREVQIKNEILLKKNEQNKKKIINAIEFLFIF